MVFDERKQAIVSGCFDRTKFKLPVCTGIPGVGKTRLLEEFALIFSKMTHPIHSNMLGILVLYFNGHALQPVESRCSMEQSFCWRLLHRYFLEGRVGFEVFMEKLLVSPLFPDHLTLVNTVRAICRWHAIHHCEACDVASEPMSIFIGVDEYQSLSRLDDNTVVPPEESKLETLLLLLVSATQQLAAYHIHLYCMFAGTEWCKLSGIGSSSTIVRRIAVPFLSPREFCSIAASVFPASLRSEVFRQCLFSVGDIARNVVEFAVEAKGGASRASGQLSAERLTMIRRRVEASNNGQWSALLSARSLLRLAAFSLSGLHIPDPSLLPCPAIPIKETSGQEQLLTWQQLADRGLLQLEDVDCGFRVAIPNIVIRQCAAYYRGLSDADYRAWDASEIAFLKSVCAVQELADARLLQPWQPWEHFGAIFHCLRINSLLVLERTTVDIRSLFRGSRMDGLHGDMRVVLAPAYVLESEDALGPELDLTAVREKSNALFQVNLFQERDNCPVVMNAGNAEAVDVFIMFRTEASGAYVLFMDQRKRDSTSVTTGQLKKFHAHMLRMRPGNPTTDSITVITGVFSALAGYGKRAVKVPAGSLVFTRDDLRFYHGSLANHIAANALVDPHSCKKSLLAALLGSAVAGHIVQLRKEGHVFRSFTELNATLASACSCSIAREHRHYLFFECLEDSDDDIVGNVHDDDDSQSESGDEQSSILGIEDMSIKNS